MYDFSYKQMSDNPSRASQAVGLKSRTLFELQHGGASDDSAAGASMLYVQNRGRWASDKSVRRYAKEGILQEAWREVPDHVRSFRLLCTRDIWKIL